MISRKLSPHIVVASSSFKRFNKINFGARMALFHYDNSVVVWLALPYGEEVAKAIQLVTGGDKSPVTHLIVPDREHTMAAKSFKAEFPELKIIAMDTVTIPGVNIDHKIGAEYAHKLIDRDVLQEIGIVDEPIVNNFQFVYLPEHANNELVTFDLNSKILFEADLLFNLGHDDLEQFSVATGFSSKFYPHSGWSYMTRYLQPYSKIGNALINKITNTKKSAEGLRQIYKWDFEQIVMCHGNIIDTEAKAAFKSVFGSVLP